MITTNEVKTKPFQGEWSEQDKLGMQKAIEQAELGLSEGGVPIGACLIRNSTGEVLGVGRNKRVQKGSPTLHGETDCLENIGRLPANVYRDCTIYTTLSPCTMCTGCVILYNIPRLVMGENDTFIGGEDWLANKGIEVVNLNSDKCKSLMAEFIKRYPDVWNEDIGEE
ncbi:cytidine deaminase-like protein [Cystobasidium minutum MCA 4210]|uniref:cytidine deaminase-like protein n=1 Tax=Cystobasidium minutum MCA 4210 TaxID=1397322 RepID=UPI0034CF9960|eukprot:jgi/Rhomi1/32928/CE32927_624